LTFRSFRRSCFSLLHRKLSGFDQALPRFVHEALYLCFFAGPTQKDSHNNIKTCMITWRGVNLNLKFKRTNLCKQRQRKQSCISSFWSVLLLIICINRLILNFQTFWGFLRRLQCQKVENWPF
jgi:hypothetical protein